MSLWKSQDAALATGGKNTLSWSANGVSIDSRTIQKGDLFIALKAERDGHKFVENAFQNGAAAALVDHVPNSLDASCPLLLVPNVMKALQSMASFARNRFKGKVIAVTGSVGKTSTKEMLHKILSDQGETHSSFASYNNHWGVPLTLTRMPEGADFSVIEIGMNHPGEIAPLSVLAKPDIALITSVAPAHLAAFKNIEEIAREKASIAKGLKGDSSVIINQSITTAEVLKSEIVSYNQEFIGYGSSGCSSKILNIDEIKNWLHVGGLVEGEEHNFCLNTSSTHFAENALGSLVVVRKVNCDVTKACESLRSWTPGIGRGSIKKINVRNVGLIELIDDGYNANPTSVLAALETLSKSKSKRRIAILGDMKELGPSEVDFHKSIASLASMAKVDCVYTVGPLMKNLHNSLPKEKRGQHFKNSLEVVPELSSILKRGDCLLLKASLSVGVSVISDAISDLEG